MLVPGYDLQMSGLKWMKASLRSRPASRSVEWERVCSYCHNILGKAAMIIESLGLCYHLHCFKVRLMKQPAGLQRFAWRAHGFFERWVWTRH